MRPSVYIETTIPSFCFEPRRDADMLARRRWTRLWWDTYSTNYRLVTSEAVIDELECGTYPQKREVIQLVNDLPILMVTEEPISVVEAYIHHQVMPRDPAGDALHLALASCHGCDFLLTWNCAHLANANKFAHMRRINTILGIACPSVVTPLELLSGEEDPP